MASSITRNISYEIIEEIEDHSIFGDRYNSQTITGKFPPHVTVFTNFLPDLNKLFIDRWVLFKIKDNDLKLQLADKKYINDVNPSNLSNEEINQIEVEKDCDFLYKEIYTYKILADGICR